MATLKDQPLKEMKWSLKVPNQKRERNGIRRQTCQKLKIKKKKRKKIIHTHTHTHTHRAPSKMVGTSPNIEIINKMLMT